MPKTKTKRDEKTVLVRNIHRTSRINGIAPGAMGRVSEAIAKRYPMYYERVEKPTATPAKPKADKTSMKSEAKPTDW